MKRPAIFATIAAAAVVATAVAVPSIAFAADASYRSLASAHNPDWMSRLPNDRNLASLSIPGTHDTMAIHGGSLTETQENYGDSGGALAAQLDSGIRVVDLRARINEGNTFTMHHGATYQNANFDDVLNRLGDFLRAHPGETVLMLLKQECTGEIGSCKDASGQKSFPDIFNAYAAKRPGLFWQPSITRTSAAPMPNLGAVRGKVILGVMLGRQSGVIEHYGLDQFSGWHDGSSEYVQNEYTVPNIGAIATKRDQVRRFLDKTSAGDPSKMYVNVASGSSLFAYPYQVAGGALGVQGVDPFLLIYLNEGPDVHTPVHRTGVILMDFPGGGLIDKILTFN